VIIVKKFILESLSTVFNININININIKIIEIALKWQEAYLIIQKMKLQN